MRQGLSVSSPKAIAWRRPNSGKHVPPAAQLPFESDPPQVPRKIQAKPALEAGRGRLQPLPVDLRAAFLEGKHDDVVILLCLQRHESISKHVAYLVDVRGATVHVAAHI